MGSCEVQFCLSFNTAKPKKPWCKKFEFWYESKKDGSNLDAKLLVQVYLFPHLINLAQDTCLRNYNILWNLVSKYFCFWNRLFSVCMNMQFTTLLSFKTSWMCVLMLKKNSCDNLCKVLSHFHSWRLSCVHVYVLLESCCLYL